MTSALPPLRVLLVDDDADQRFLVRRLFGRAGLHDVVEAADGSSALRRVDEGPVDLVVLDLAMPVRSGFEVLPELQDRLGTTPIVVLSNFRRGRLQRAVLDRGAVGYVEKRVANDRLVHELLLAAALAGDAAERLTSRFPRDVTSPGQARRFVRGLLDDHDDQEILASVELLVSELVMNAVEHAGSEPRVDVQLALDHVRVEVFDDDQRLPSPRSAKPDEPTGRGLRLVSHVAHRWGAEPHDEGKVVWFELDRGPVVPHPGA